jgi:hypothetical protein
MKLKAKDFIDNHNLVIGEHLKLELESLINSGEFYPYVVDSYSDDKLNICNVYGDFKNDRLYMTLTNNGNVYYGRINSGIIHPSMIDRKFGIDKQDSDWLGKLADVLAYVYVEKHTLEQWIDAIDKLS